MLSLNDSSHGLEPVVYRDSLGLLFLKWLARKLAIIIPFVLILWDINELMRETSLIAWVLGYLGLQLMIRDRSESINHADKRREV